MIFLRPVHTYDICPKCGWQTLGEISPPYIVCLHWGCGFKETIEEHRRRRERRRLGEHDRHPAWH